MVREVTGKEERAHGWHTFAHDLVVQREQLSRAPLGGAGEGNLAQTTCVQRALSIDFSVCHGVRCAIQNAADSYAEFLQYKWQLRLT
jgi:DNA-binding phage protein